jgi:putative spermidine/putrescine transport system substrate-binding protein
LKTSLRAAGISLVAMTAVAALAACAPPASTSSAGKAATATSATDLGGMDALIAAAKKEGAVNVIALPNDWANYGAIKKGFTAKYGITINDAKPDGSSQEEVNAITQNKGTGKGPDVVDVGMSVATNNVKLFAPYKVATWADVVDAQKESTGLWTQDYGGFMAIGYDSAKVPAVTSITDLLKPGYKGAVALSGDPTGSNSAKNAVLLASVLNGGSVDDVSKGIDFFKQLKAAGNFLPAKGNAAAVKAGTVKVLLEWDYLQAPIVKQVPTWKTFVPAQAVLGGYYAQAISVDAPHPAAARLWEEYLYSDEGQNLFLAGSARPVRQDAMTKSGKIDATMAAALPAVTGTPVFPTVAQGDAAGVKLTAGWAAAVS